MTDAKQVRRARTYTLLLRLGGIVGIFLLAATGSLALVQTERVDNLRSVVAANRDTTDQAASTAATQYSELSTQYSKLFEACQRSTECLAHAPAEQAPVIIQGTPGAAGQSVTPAEIAQALDDYCAVNNNCVGETGAAGAAGAAGTNGTAGSNGVDGATGATGPAGPAGADGRGVQSIECVTTGALSTAFRFTLTDGTVFDIDGSCIPA